MSVKTKICDINAAAIDKLPEKTDDKSGIGVHYIDAFLKPMNTTLEDGTVVKCKRRGLKVTLTAGEYGISPGQACVFYADDTEQSEVLGGGFIAEAVPKALVA